MATSDSIADRQEVLRQLVDAFELSEAIVTLAKNMRAGRVNLEDHEAGALFEATASRASELIEGALVSLGHPDGYGEAAEAVRKAKNAAEEVAA